MSYVSKRRPFDMSMDEISDYLMSGKLNRPDPELDVYRHLRPGQSVEDGLAEIADLPTVPVGTPLNYQATMTEAVTEAIKEVGLPAFKETSFFGSNDKGALPKQKAAKSSFDWEKWSKSRK